MHRTAPPHAPRTARATWLAAGLVAAVLLFYAASLRYPLVFDDGKLLGESLRSRSWLPLELRWFPYATFGWTYALLGADPLWLRLGNVLLHAAVGALLFLFLRRLLRALLPPPAPRALDPEWIAFFCALFFALHPVAVYGVAYLTQRSILMATLFSLLALACLLEGMLRGSRAWLAASVAAYFAAVFSKEHAVTLPGVAAALAFLCCRPSWAKLKGLAWVFGCYAAIALFVTLKQKGLLGAAYEPFAGALVQQIAQSQGEMASAAASAPTPGPPSTGALYVLSVENQALLFFRYLGTWLLPYPGWMSIDVHTRFPESASAPAYVAGLSAWLAYAVVAVLLLTRCGSRWALAGFALLSAWVLALAEFSTVRVQEAFVLYRSYLWMPLLGAALPALVHRVPVRWLAWGAGGVLLALLPCTVDRLRSFSSDYGLWDDAVRKVSDPRAPMVWRSYRNRGVALYNAGRYDIALGDFDRAIALDPSNAQAWLTRAVLFVHIGAAERALADLDRALALDPRSFEALGQRCIALGLLRRFPDALAACGMARDLNPADPMAHVKLGVVEALLGDLGSAEQDYLRALRIDPKQKDAHYQYAVLLQASSRGEEASAHFAVACRAGVEAACESLQRLGARPLQ